LPLGGAHGLAVPQEVAPKRNYRQIGLNKAENLICGVSQKHILGCLCLGIFLTEI
jgi:hypothetical protein